MKAPHTPGPWFWNLNKATKTIRLESLSMGSRWHEIVIDFVRWGMGGASVRFRTNNIMNPAQEHGQIVKGREHHEDWFQTINHPDARLIAAAPEMYDMLDEILKEWEQDWQGDEPRQLTDLELRLQGLMTTLNPQRNEP